jgi:hypothetical protein
LVAFRLTDLGTAGRAAGFFEHHFQLDSFVQDGAEVHANLGHDALGEARGAFVEVGLESEFIEIREMRVAEALKNPRTSLKNPRTSL